MSAKIFFSRIFSQILRENSNIDTMQSIVGVITRLLPRSYHAVSVK